MMVIEALVPNQHQTINNHYAESTAKIVPHISYSAIHALLVLCEGNHWLWLVDSLHKGTLMQKTSPCHCLIMIQPRIHYGVVSIRPFAKTISSLYISHQQTRLLRHPTQTYRELELCYTAWMPTNKFVCPLVEIPPVININKLEQSLNNNYPALLIMASRRGNLFRVTGPLSGESPVNFPHQVQSCGAWCFRCSQPERTVWQTVEMLVTLVSHEADMMSIWWFLVDIVHCLYFLSHSSIQI